MKEFIRTKLWPNGFDCEVARKNGELAALLHHLSRRSINRLGRDAMMRGLNVVNSVTMATNIAGDTRAGRSEAIWGTCPWAEYVEDPSKGFAWGDDFQMTGVAGTTASSWGSWSQVGGTGAVIQDAKLEGGVIKMDTNESSTTNIIMSSAASATFLTATTPTYNRKMWFETRFAKTSITTALMDLFVGLMSMQTAGVPVVAQPISALDTLSTTNDFFGFHSNASTGTRGGPTEVAVAFNLHGQTVVYPTGCTTLLANTGAGVFVAQSGQTGFHKLGWVYDPFDAPIRRIVTATAKQTAGNTRKALIRFFADGLENPTFLTSDDLTFATYFPIAYMAPIIGTWFAGASLPLIDWIYLAQQRTA